MSPQACTTAKQVREACEHLHAIAALDRRERQILLEITALNRELARNNEARLKLADATIAFMEPCAERLDLAENTDRYWKIPLPSEAPNRKRLTNYAIQCLDVLANVHLRREHAQARGALWALFSCYGGIEAFEQRQLGQGRVLSFTAEHRLYVAEHAGSGASA